MRATENLGATNPCVLSVTVIERTANDLVVVYLASASHSGILNLTIEHCVDRICRVQGSTLRYEVKLVHLELVTWLLTPLLQLHISFLNLIYRLRYDLTPLKVFEDWICSFELNPIPAKR